jgi:hypothetical protein
VGGDGFPEVGAQGVPAGLAGPADGVFEGDVVRVQVEQAVDVAGVHEPAVLEGQLLSAAFVEQLFLPRRSALQSR